MSQLVGGDPLIVYKHGQECELGTMPTNPASGQGGTWTWGPPITSPVLFHLATLPSYKRSEWVYEVFHLMDQRWKSYAITADKSEKRTRLFLWYPYWLREWSRGQGTHWCYYLYTCTACEYGHLLLLLATKEILQCWPPSWWNVLSSKEPGETAAFAGYWLFTLKILLSFFQS